MGRPLKPSGLGLPHERDHEYVSRPSVYVAAACVDCARLGRDEERAGTSLPVGGRCGVGTRPQVKYQKGLVGAVSGGTLPVLEHDKGPDNGPYRSRSCYSAAG